MVDLIPIPWTEINSNQPTNQPTNEISSLAQYSSKQIKKEAFLLAFKVAFKKLIIKENICVSFRGASLVLYNLEAVLLKHNIVLYTLTPPKLEDTL